MVVTVCFYFMFFCYFYNARRVKAVKLKLLDISSVNWKKKRQTRSIQSSLAF